MKKNDLSIYEEHASDWWSPRSRWFRSLRQVNRFRLGLLEEWLGSTVLRQGSGAIVVDLGCGGGFLAEPLAARGARVIGCDLSRASVAVARAHANGVADRQLLLYVQADLRRAPLRDHCADLVLLADAIEHVEDPRAALAEAARLLKPGAYLYVNTIARTARARFLAVTIAEGLRLIPRGTHDPRLFLKPGELVQLAREAGLEPVEIVTEALRPLATLFTWTIHVKRKRTRWPVGMIYSALLRYEGVAAKAAAAAAGL